MPQTPGMRAPKWDERIRGKIGEFYESLAKQPLLQLIGRLESDSRNTYVEDQNRRVQENIQKKYGPNPLAGTTPARAARVWMDIFGDPTDVGNLNGPAKAAVFPAAVTRARMAPKFAQHRQVLDQLVDKMPLEKVAKLESAIVHSQKKHPRVLAGMDSIGYFAEEPDAVKGLTHARVRGARNADVTKQQASLKKEFLEQQRDRLRQNNPAQESLDDYTDTAIADSLQGTGHLQFNTSEKVNFPTDKLFRHELAHGAQNQIKWGDRYGQWAAKYGKSTSSLHPHEIGAEATANMQQAKATTPGDRPRSYVDVWIDEANRRLKQGGHQMQGIGSFESEILPEMTERFGIGKNKNQELALVPDEQGNPVIIRQQIGPTYTPYSQARQTKMAEIAKRKEEALNSQFEEIFKAAAGDHLDSIPKKPWVKPGTFPKTDINKYPLSYQLGIQTGAHKRMENIPVDDWFKINGKVREKATELGESGKLYDYLQSTFPEHPAWKLEQVSKDLPPQSLDAFISEQTGRRLGKLRPAVMTKDGEVLVGGSYHFSAAEYGGVNLDDVRRVYVNDKGEVVDANNLTLIEGKHKVREVAPPMSQPDRFNKLQDVLKRKRQASGEGDDYWRYLGKKKDQTSLESTGKVREADEILPKEQTPEEADAWMDIVNTKNPALRKFLDMESPKDAAIVERYGPRADDIPVRKNKGLLSIGGIKKK